MQKGTKYITGIFSLALALIVVFSTSGFKLYTHHCSSSQIQNVSIIIPAEACGHAEQAEKEQGCCVPINEVVDDACCKQVAPKSEDDNCCSDKEQYLKLDTKTLVNHTTPILKVNETNSFVALFIINNLLSNNASSFAVANYSTESPPKLLTEYLSFIQVYLI